MRYFEDRYLAPDQSSLTLAYRNADVRRLNEQIREVRRAAGELGSAVRLKGRDLATGDRVLFLRNDHTGRHVRTVEGQGRGVKNGALGTLLEAEPHRLRIRLDSGRLVELDPRTYNRLTHGYAVTVHKAQGATVDRAYVLADRGFDRNLSYVALTRHRHQLALYVDRETFASGEQLRGVLAREPRKDLVRDYQTSGAPRLTPKPVAGETPSEVWAPSVETGAAGLSPERLDRLQTTLGQLERWDELVTRSKHAARARHKLPYHGNLPDLDRKIRTLERPPRFLNRDLSQIYRQPEAAQESLEQAALENGPAEAFRRLQETPENFGRLNGRQVLTRPTRNRAKAIDLARSVGSQGVRRNRNLEELRTAREAADRYRIESLDLPRQRKAISPDRTALVDELRSRAIGLDPDQLNGRVPARYLKTLRDLHHQDEMHLAPLRNALHAFHRAHKTSTHRATLFSIARDLSAIHRATPQKLLSRLAPPQLRLLLSATSAAAAIVRKLAPEYEHAESRRSVLKL